MGLDSNNINLEKCAAITGSAVKRVTVLSFYIQLFRLFSLFLIGSVAGCFVFGASLVSAEILGDRVQVRCESADGLVGETEIKLARFNANPKLFASVGDGLWIERTGSSIMRRLIEVEEGNSLHLYLLAERQLKKSKKVRNKHKRVKQQLVLTQVGMFGSYGYLKTAAKAIRIKLRLDAGRTFDTELKVYRAGPSKFNCHFTVLD